jgi:hypothetical protein
MRTNTRNIIILLIVAVVIFTIITGQRQREYFVGTVGGSMRIMQRRQPPSVGGSLPSMGGSLRMSSMGGSLPSMVGSMPSMGGSRPRITNEIATATLAVAKAASPKPKNARETVSDATNKVQQNVAKAVTTAKAAFFQRFSRLTGSRR